MAVDSSYFNSLHLRVHMNKTKEEWRLVDGWPYEVSNLGRVRRAKAAQRTRPGRIRRPKIQHGYESVALYRNNQRSVFRVQHLVLEAFVGLRPTDSHETNHIDGNKRNNTPENLEWVTHSENVQHSIDTGLSAVGSDYCHATLTEDEVLEVRRRYAGGSISQEQLSRDYDTSRTTIQRIVAGKAWKHVGGPITDDGTRRGDRVPSACLGPKEVQDIRSLYERHDAATYDNLASVYGVSIQAISKVVRRESWKHL